uniref:Uncharacterized protein n=1 Tax=Myotis myotis TaxID=51298 RepID=A0A7J8AMF7_MYOMY|nr:hypothetical protein mMyoMyo1_007908 [Myotis myotis]
MQALLQNSPDREEISHGGEVHGRPPQQAPQPPHADSGGQAHHPVNKTDHRKDLTVRLRDELVLGREDRYQYDCLAYRRLYLPLRATRTTSSGQASSKATKIPSFGLKIVMLSFHGKYARVTKITGDSIGMLEIHLMRRIQLPDGEIFRNFNELALRRGPGD